MVRNRPGTKNLNLNGLKFPTDFGPGLLVPVEIGLLASVVFAVYLVI